MAVNYTNRQRIFERRNHRKEDPESGRYFDFISSTLVYRIQRGDISRHLTGGSKQSAGKEYP
jgi:hypothetical protein